MRFTLPPTVAALAVAFLTPTAFAGDEVTFIRFSDGLAYGVSDDGSTVVGERGGDAYVYDVATGTLTGIGQVGAVAVNGDGTVVTGDTSGPAGDSAGRYRFSDGWTVFGGLGASGCGSSLSSAYDISSDGDSCVGLGWNGCSAGAFLWTAADGMEALPQSGPNSSRADTISGDGTVIGGWDESGSGGRRAARWQRDRKSGAWSQSLILAGTPGNAAGIGEVNGSNGDGSIVVGSAEGTSNATSGAYVYSSDTGIRLLGLLPPTASPVVGGALDVTEDGTTVVGFQRQGVGGGQSFRATSWTEETGLVDLQDQLETMGANIPSNFTLAAAMSMSDDGRVICGWGYADNIVFFQGSWIVVLPEEDDPCPADLNGDGTVGGADIGLLLVSYGTEDPNADLDGSGTVDGGDLGLILAAWGACSQ